MRIQHNIINTNAYRNYTNNVSAIKKNLEKLSSGYKINRAGDGEKLIDLKHLEKDDSNLLREAAHLLTQQDKVSMGMVCSTFVIGEDGVIKKVMPKVKPDTNAEQVLAWLKEEG